MAADFSSEGETDFLRHRCAELEAELEALKASKARSDSERQQSETELKTLSAQLDALIRSSSEVRYSINADWTELAQLSGGGFIPDNSAANPGWLDDYIPEQDRDAVRAEIARSIATKGTYNIEHRVNLVGGGIGWALSRAVPLLDKEGEITSWMGAASDITRQKLAEDNLRVLNQELAHRMKNTLAMVQAIATQTLRPPADIETAKDAFIARLQALASAQNTLTQASWVDADIGDVVRGAMQPHMVGDNRITIGGPRVELASHQALGLALAIHELATNAVKHGALLNATGRVEIAWTSNGQFVFSWIESNGPTVSSPKGKGFGSKLLERIVPAYFNGSSNVAFDAAGLRFHLVGESQSSSLPQRLDDRGV